MKRTLNQSILLLSGALFLGTVSVTLGTGVNLDGIPTCDSTCKECEECDGTATGDPASANHNSVDLSFDLGGASFERPTNFSSYHAAALANFGDPHLMDDYSSMKGYFDQAELSGLWRAELRLKSDTITADTFKVSSLDYNHAQKMEVIEVGGEVRQVLTHHFLVDVQALPSGQEGFELEWYYAADKGAAGAGGVYALPASSLMVKGVKVSNPTPGTYNTVDVHSVMDTPGGSTRRIHYRYVFGTNSGQVEHRMETWTDVPTLSGATKIEEDTLLYLSGSPTSNTQERIRTIKRADLTAGGSYGTLTTVSRLREKFLDVGGKKLISERTRLSSTTNDTAGLKTTYGYYNSPTNSFLHGHRRWQKNPDGSWIVWVVSATESSQNVKKITPFEDGTFVLADDGSNVSSVAENEAFVEHVVVTGSKVTTTRKALGQTVGYKEEDYLTGTGGERIVRTKRMYAASTSSSYLTSVRAFNPYGNGSSEDAGRIAWEVFEDGTAKTYSYDADNIGGMAVTVRSGATNGAGTSSAPTISAGTEIETSYNKFWEAYAETTTDIESNLMTGSWTGSLYDLYGRPQRIEYNGNGDDYSTIERTCCGPSEERDRSGAVTTYLYDLLKRQYRMGVKRSSGGTEIVTTTTRSGLVTTSMVTAGSIGFTSSKTVRNLLGETTERWSADADGDANGDLEKTTILTEYFPTAGGTQITSTDPEGGTTVSLTYRDGRTESVTGSAVSNTSYDYGIHSHGSGGGLSTKVVRETATGGNAEWVLNCMDRLGRNIRTEYPDGSVQETGYHASSASSGSRGKLRFTKDPDEVAMAGEGSKVYYAYSGEGELETTTDYLADSATRLTTTLRSVVEFEETEEEPNNPPVNDGVYFKSVTKIGDGTSEIISSTTYTSVDGYLSYADTLGGLSSRERTAPTSGSPINGSWSVTSVTVDGQSTEETYTDGLLEKSELFDNAETPVLITRTTYTHDDLGRVKTAHDLRTGTVTYSGLTGTGYTPSGNLLGMKDSGNRLTKYGYDRLGRRLTVTHPDNTVTNTSYTARGQVEAQWGSQVYPTFRTYDEQGRMLTLRTSPTLSGQEPTDAGGSVTSWIYDPQRGWLIEKNYDGETDDPTGDPVVGVGDYTYTDAGRLATRVWERGVTTTYTYDQGMIESVSYSDTTPGVTYVYNSLGQIDNVTQSRVKHSFEYSPTTMALIEEVVEYNTNGDETRDFVRIIDRHQDDKLRPEGLELRTNGDPAIKENKVSYGYDSAGRLEHVDPVYPLSGSPAYEYEYEDNSYRLVKSVIGPVHTVSNKWEGTRNVLDSKKNEDTAGTASVPSSFDYTVNSLGQRTAVAPMMDDADPPAPISTYSVKWTWDYNGRGELESADHGSDSTPNSSDRFYEFDAIGNRDYVRTGTYVNSDVNGTKIEYSANKQNQYTGAAQSFQYDLDGNLKQGALVTGALQNVAGTSYTGTLVWDGENRLVEVLEGTTSKVKYSYDYRGRRISRTTGAGTTWYIYDGWNVIAEYSGTTLDKSYTWGMDLSGSMQGAGGVGGLLAVTHEGATGDPVYYPAYDGNGNVTEYLKSDGTAVVHFEYDPFGRLISNNDATGAFPIRFSTKMQEDLTGLYYYGYRWYDPLTGRWPSMDPIEEEGGLNLYGFIRNDAVNSLDYLGAMPVEYPDFKVPTVDENAKLNKGLGMFDWKVSIFIKWDLDRGLSLEGKRCCLKAVISEDAPPMIFLDKAKISEAAPPDNSVGRVIEHEMMHWRAYWSKITYLGRWLSLEQTCYRSHEAAKRAKDEIQAFYDSWWLWLQIDEENHHDTGGFGTPPAGGID